MAKLKHTKNNMRNKFREMNVIELNTRKKEISLELMLLRRKQAMGMKPEKGENISNIKKSIALINQILTEKKNETN